jgi:hypothetical protein
MIYKCTDYDYISLKGYTKDIDTNNFNTIQKASYLITDCLELQTEDNERTINRMIQNLQEIIKATNENDHARIEINRLLGDFKQGVK